MINLVLNSVQIYSEIISFSFPPSDGFWYFDLSCLLCTEFSLQDLQAENVGQEEAMKTVLI